jgi:hypothetical protein
VKNRISFFPDSSHSLKYCDQKNIRKHKRLSQKGGRNGFTQTSRVCDTPSHLQGGQPVDAKLFFSTIRNLFEILFSLPAKAFCIQGVHLKQIHIFSFFRKNLRNDQPKDPNQNV